MRREVYGHGRGKELAEGGGERNGQKQREGGREGQEEGKSGGRELHLQKEYHQVFLSILFGMVPLLKSVVYSEQDLCAEDSEI